MPNSEVLDTIETLLDSTLDETEDPDVNYKLRTALQLLDVVRNQQASVADSLADADMDDDLRGQLRDLGYLE